MSGGLTGLAWRSLHNRRVTVLLTVLTLAMAVAVLLSVERLRTEARQGLQRSVAGTDLIVGARSHPVHLLMYSVFHLGEPTHGIGWNSYQFIAEHPSVAWAVPIALGDSYRGHRVVGTNADYFARVGGDEGALGFTAGRAFDDVFEAVLGAEVARRLGHAVGDRIVLAHGTGRSALHTHDDRPFEVAGILAPTGTPLDHGVYVSLASIEAIHLNWRGGTRVGRAPDVDDERLRSLRPRSVSAVFVGTRSRAGVFALQRDMSGYREEALSAVLPGVGLQQLWSLLSGGERALRWAGVGVFACALMVLLTGVLATLNERRREMALLRAVGAGARHVFALLLIEAAFLVTSALVLGVVVTQAALWLAAPWLQTQYGFQIAAGWPRAGEWRLLAMVLGTGLLVGLVPAIAAFRRSVHDGMTMDR